MLPNRQQNEYQENGVYENQVYSYHGIAWRQLAHPNTHDNFPDHITDQETKGYLLQSSQFE